MRYDGLHLSGSLIKQLPTKTSGYPFLGTVRRYPEARGEPGELSACGRCEISPNRALKGRQSRHFNTGLAKYTGYATGAAAGEHQQRSLLDALFPKLEARLVDQSAGDSVAPDRASSGITWPDRWVGAVLVAARGLGGPCRGGMSGHHQGDEPVGCALPCTTGCRGGAARRCRW
jgi:hypothetical protein